MDDLKYSRIDTAVGVHSPVAPHPPSCEGGGGGGGIGSIQSGPLTAMDGRRLTHPFLVSEGEEMIFAISPEFLLFSANSAIFRNFLRLCSSFCSAHIYSKWEI